MTKCSNYICIYTLIASLSIGTALADDNNMSGLYIGLGANIGYDEYDARANVGQSRGYSITVDKTANTNDVTLEDGNSANNLVTKLWECVKTGEPQDITYKDTDDDPEVTIVSSKEIAGNEVSIGCADGDSSSSYTCRGKIEVYAQKQSGNDLNDLCYDSYPGIHLHDDISCSITEAVLPTSGYYYKADDGAIPTDVFSNGTTYYKVKVYEGTLKSTITPDKTTYIMSQSLHRSGHNAGGEMKMAYFHDFGNHLMAGLDLTGAVLSKNRRDIQVSKFNVNDVYPELTLTSNGTTIATATYNDDDSSYTTTVTGGGTIEAAKSLTLSSNYEDFKSAAMQANPGMQVTSDPITGEYLDVSSGDKDVSFEKGIFNPKLAFVVGGTYNGWFAGLRAGVSYNTGKIKAPDMTSSKSVSIASPLVGLQVMKKVSDNTNLYMTADWNVGDLRKSVDINGIKSFKQSSYNISAGVQWKCSFLK